jgi:hypothetical protein
MTIYAVLLEIFQAHGLKEELFELNRRSAKNYLKRDLAI